MRDAGAGNGCYGPAAVGGGFADAGSWVWLLASERVLLGDLGGMLPRNPLPPQTTSFFFAADAIGRVWCGAIAREGAAIKFGDGTRVLMSLHRGSDRRAEQGCF